MDEQLSEQERLVRDTAKRYAQDKLAPRILEAVNTYEGTHDIHALILGRAQTGIQDFY